MLRQTKERGRDVHAQIILFSELEVNSYAYHTVCSGEGVFYAHRVGLLGVVVVEGLKPCGVDLHLVGHVVAKAKAGGL